jgi:hypothetical protein
MVLGLSFLAANKASLVTYNEAAKPRLSTHVAKPRAVHARCWQQAKACWLQGVSCLACLLLACWPAWRGGWQLSSTRNEFFVTLIINLLFPRTLKKLLLITWKKGSLTSERPLPLDAATPLVHFDVSLLS